MTVALTATTFPEATIAQGVVDYHFSDIHVNSDEDIRAFVRVDETVTELVYGVDFTTRIANSKTEGTVTLSNTATIAYDGAVLIRERDTALTQPTRLENNGPFFAEDIEKMADRAVLMVQEQRANGLKNTATASAILTAAETAVDTAHAALSGVAYGTHAQALADIDAIPEGGFVTIVSDEDHANAQTIRRRDGSSLTFVKLTAASVMAQFANTVRFVKESVDDLLASDQEAFGNGSIWYGGAYSYVEDTANHDITTAGGVRLRYLYGNMFHLEALGTPSRTTLDAAIQKTAGSLTPIVSNTPFNASLNSAQSANVISAWDRIWFLRHKAVLILEAGDYNQEDGFINLTNPWLRNLEISGKQYSKRDVTAAEVVSAAPFNHVVRVTLASSTDLLIGEYITITDTDGDVGHSVMQGVCEVLAAQGNDQFDIRVQYPEATLPDTLLGAPTDGVTPVNITAGRWRRVNTILSWTSGRGLAVTTTGGEIRNLVIKGYFDPAVDAPSDGPNDGVLIGDQANTELTGSTESEQINYGYIQMTSVAVVNWPNNGFQNKGGKMKGTDIVVSACGHRGFQSGNGGKATVKGLVSTWNGASNVETEGNGTINASDGVFSGGSEQGVYSIGGNFNISDCLMEYNGTHGVDAKTHGRIAGKNIVSRQNGFHGVRGDDGTVSCETSTITDNARLNAGSFDVSAIDMGVVNVRGGTVGNYDVQRGGRVLQADGTVLG